MFEFPTYAALAEAVEFVVLDTVALLCTTGAVEADVFVVLFVTGAVVLSELVHPDIPTIPKIKTKTSTGTILFILIPPINIMIRSFRVLIIKVLIQTLIVKFMELSNKKKECVLMSILYHCKNLMYNP